MSQVCFVSISILNAFDAYIKQTCIISMSPLNVIQVSSVNCSTITIKLNNTQNNIEIPQRHTNQSIGKFCTLNEHFTSTIYGVYNNNSYNMCTNKYTASNPKVLG